MARVTLMPGIESISGKVGNVVFTTRKNGKVYMHPANSMQRKTAVRKSEIVNRSAFTKASEEWRTIDPFMLNTWENRYARAEDKGKYKTLRGYFIAKTMEYYKKKNSEPEKVPTKSRRTPDKRSRKGKTNYKSTN